MTQPDEYTIKQRWTVKEVAYYLQLNPNTVRDLAKAGVLPHYLIPTTTGSRTIMRFDPQDIEQFKVAGNGRGALSPTEELVVMQAME